MSHVSVLARQSIGWTNDHQLLASLAALVAAALLVACPSSGGLADDDDITPPSADDDDAFDFSGQVTYRSDGSPVTDLEVSIGDLLTTTDDEGRYLLSLEEGPPQQVDFYESATTAASYADCDFVHDHQMSEAAGRSERGSPVEVTVLLHGLSDPSGFRGKWLVEEALGDTTWFHHSDLGPSQLEVDDDGTARVVFESDPGERWWLSVSELDGTLVAWAVETGGEFAGAAVELEATLTSEGLTDVTWSGEASEVVTEVSVQQVVELVNGHIEVQLPLMELTPDGTDRAMPAVEDVASLSFLVEIQRADFADCSWHFQEWDVDLPALDTPLAVPELFEVPRLDPALGGDNWGFAPEVVWSGFPDDPSGWAGGYIFAFPPGGNYLTWALVPDTTCGPETANWPVGLASIPAESAGFVDAYYFGSDRAAGCTHWVEWPAL
jgi:hypothetical protein